MDEGSATSLQEIMEPRSSVLLLPILQGQWFDLKQFACAVDSFYADLGHSCSKMELAICSSIEKRTTWPW